MLPGIDPPIFPPLVLAVRRVCFPASGFPASYGRKRSNIAFLSFLFSLLFCFSFSSALFLLFSFPSFLPLAFVLRSASALARFSFPSAFRPSVARRISSTFRRCARVANNAIHIFCAVRLKISINNKSVKKIIRVCAQQTRVKMNCFSCCYYVPIF